MAVRIKDGIIPYTWWIWIEITNNHVINVLLRELNNLIHVNENRELYVDLQLEDWIEPDYDFPVGVTTWKILQEDWWQQSWIILNWKTTSWDYVRLIYANDGKLYYDPWTWEWIELATGESIAPILENLNVKMFEIDSTSETTVGQEVVDWYLDWNYPIVVYNNQSYIQEATPTQWQIRFYWIHTTEVHGLNNWTSSVCRNVLYATYVDGEFTWWMEDFIQISPTVVWVGVWYQTAFTPTDDWDPATKKYVDDWLATKQDILTPWTRITIDQNNVISADISGVMTYMWNVTDSSALPSSWQNQWDCWYDETAKTLWAWDGTQWNDIGGTWIDLTNYFNMQTNTSDDITEWSTNLFVTSTEKNTWNNKQDQLTAGTNITIDSNNVISSSYIDTTYTEGDGIEITNQNVINNTAKFDPANAGTMGQFLKKTNDGYQWADVPSWSSQTYTAWDGIDITNNVISATDRFTPTNQWSTGQVLKKSGANSYYWANESWWGGWGSHVSNTPYWPSWDGVTDTAPSKNAIYDKIESMVAWEGNVKLFTLNNTTDTATMQQAMDWLAQDKMPIVRVNTTYWYEPKQWYYYFYPVIDSTSTSTHFIFQAIPTSNQSYILPSGVVRRYRPIIAVDLNNGTVTWISVTTSEAAREDIVRQWIGTQAQYDALVNQSQIEQWVIYNIIPS